MSSFNNNFISLNAKNDPYLFEVWLPADEDCTNSNWNTIPVKNEYIISWYQKVPPETEWVYKSKKQMIQEFKSVDDVPYLLWHIRTDSDESTVLLKLTFPQIKKIC